MKNNYANLDFIRTIAVLSVLDSHLLVELDTGRVGIVPVHLLGIFGVMLFFVLTSNVLMLSLERLQADQGQRAALSFYVQRIFRIYPLSVAVVLIGWLLTLHGNVPGFRRLNPAELFSNLFLVENLTHSPDAIGPLWTLPLEIQMYLFLPLIYFLLRKSTTAMMATYAAAVPLAIAAFKLPLPDVFRYFPCFIPGAIAFGILRHYSPQKIFPFWALPVMLAAIGVAYALLGAWSQTVAAYPACLLLGLFIPFVHESRNAYLNSFCAFVAKYSYGIYLIHGPVLAIAFSLPLHPVVKVLAYFSVTTLAAMLSYRYLEAPLTAMGKKLTSMEKTAASFAT